MSPIMRSIIKTLYGIVLDALFPLSHAEKEIASLAPAAAFNALPRSPKPPIADASAVFAYKDERVSRMIWNIKYKKDFHSAKIGAFALDQKIRELFNDQKVIIIPMPSTDKRRKERGYNQCEFITEELQRLRPEHYHVDSTLLFRVHHDSHHKFKDRAERLASAKGIFEVRPQDLIIDVNAEYIIIDDVITTGSTMTEAIQTLRNAGFTNVIGIGIAH
jgi:ComF family protein